MNNLNIFELAILFALAENYPRLYTHIDKLHVTERECTGVGQYIHFKYQDEMEVLPFSEDILSVDKLIVVSGLEVGLGFVGNTSEGKLNIIEVFVYGSDSWDCNFEGFYLKNLNFS